MFWQHKYKAISTNIRFEPFRDLLSGEIHKDCGGFRTDVLLKCECNKLKVQALKGKWTLDEVTKNFL